MYLLNHQNYEGKELAKENRVAHMYFESANLIDNFCKKYIKYLKIITVCSALNHNHSTPANNILFTTLNECKSNIKHFLAFMISESLTVTTWNICFS